MEFKKTAIEGVIFITPAIFNDNRGSFMESFNLKEWKDQGVPFEFVQDNQSISSKGVIRGLHFQREPHAQGKLVRVVHGKALDVIVDIRKDSPTFGRHLTFQLDGSSNNMVYIPPGCAHGFEALEDDTVFIYKVTDYYEPSSEAGIRYDDPALAIKWSTPNPIVSTKDLLLPTLAEWSAAG